MSADRAERSFPSTPSRGSSADRAKIAQVDVRPEALGNRCSLHLGLLGTVKDTLEAVLPAMAVAYYAVNARLPADVIIRAAAEVPHRDRHRAVVEAQLRVRQVVVVEQQDVGRLDPGERGDSGVLAGHVQLEQVTPAIPSVPSLPVPDKPPPTPPEPEQWPEPIVAKAEEVPVEARDAAAEAAEAAGAPIAWERAVWALRMRPAA